MREAMDRELRGGSGNAARQPTVRGSVASENTSSARRQKSWFHTSTISPPGAFFMVDFKIPVKPCLLLFDLRQHSNQPGRARSVAGAINRDAGASAL
jgi:hypothetical protein